MIGMSASTGKALSGDAHLAQSIWDILSTPLGSRVMRRDYGSLLLVLMDRPLNTATAMLMRSAIVLALAQWETRISISQVSLSGDVADGQLVATISGARTDQAGQNSLTSLTIPIRAAAKAAS